METYRVGFFSWITHLANDAARRGCLGRFKRSCDLVVWMKVYEQGGLPTIPAVLAWATMCPDRFEELRETEEAYDLPIAA